MANKLELSDDNYRFTAVL